MLMGGLILAVLLELWSRTLRARRPGAGEA